MSRIDVVTSPSTPPDDAAASQARAWPKTWLGPVVWTVVIAGCGLMSWLMTGPPPSAAPTASRVDAPPFVVRDRAAAKSLERSAAAALRAGQWATAASLFERMASDRPSDPMPAVGLVISRWHRMGATNAIRALDRIGDQHSDDPWVTLERGLARVMTSAPDTQAVLEQARSSAQLSRATLDVARHADDVLHPNIASGYPPLLVRAGDSTSPTVIADINRIVAAVRLDDRRTAARVASAVPRNTSSTAAAVAAALGRFSKDRPLTTTSELAVIRDRSITGSDRAMASLHHAIVVIWVSGPTRALPELRQVAHQADSGRWGQQAVAIERALAARS